jgi:TatD DNase family protein
MKVQFIDLHSHVDFYKDNEIPSIVEDAREKGVLIVDSGAHPKMNKRVLELADKYNWKVTLGLYPIDIIGMKDSEIDKEIDFIRKNKDKIIGIGEVGLDFKEDLHKWERQKEVFRKVIALAKEIDKPLIIHSRKAEKEAIEILEEEKAEKVVMHCFNGSFKLIDKIVANKWYMTIPSNVTFSEHFQKAIEIVPISQLFCETDSPYLHPKKERNNVPGNVIESYKKVAEIKGLKLDEVKAKIYDNFERLFGN